MEVVIKIQMQTCNQITKDFKNYKKSPKDRITKPYIEIRLQRLEELWKKFCEGHDRLLEEYSAEYDTSIYAEKEVFDVTSEIYMEYKEELLTAAQMFIGEVMTKNSKDQLSENAVSKQVCIKLPKIVIPIFSGNYSEWVTFKDLFESLVHNNSTIKDVEKLHYLKGYLTGEAELLLRQIPISNANYSKCWELLKQRYDNKRFICNMILKRFLSQKNAAVESSTFLKELIDTSSDCLSALANIGVDVSTWDAIVIHLLTLKLDQETRKQWELSATGGTDSNTLPSFQEFKDFITNRFRALEFVETKKPSSGIHHFSQVKPRVLHTVQNTQCPCCSEIHKITFCKQYAALDVNARRNFVQEKGLCFNCLGNNHSAKFCQNATSCKICKRRHHTLLHPTDATPANTSGAKVSNVGTVEAEEPPLVTNCFARGTGQVLLATAIVNAKSKSGVYMAIRALLDQGSQASFITEATAQYLGLKKEPIKGNISGLGGDNNLISKAMVILHLQSLAHPNINISVQAYVLKTITSFLPANKVMDLNGLNITGIQLADPDYHTPNKIDVLLGAEVYSRVIQDGVRKNNQGTLLAQSTTLGWILSGIVDSFNTTFSGITVLHSQINEDNILKSFWEIEADSSSQKKLLSEEEERCESIFAASTKRDSEGRYVVKLPFREEDPSCKYGHSNEVAAKRFYSLENRLHRDTELQSKYKEVIDEYLHLGHMVEVPENDKNENAVCLPHHPVVKMDRETTKVRVVFDASCKGKNGISLNDDLMIGPKLQPDLRHLVMKWRMYPICLVSDIVKMYRQVKVTEEDADFQRILWRENSNEVLKEYKLLRVTFGTACAPYLAVKALQQVAIDHGKDYPMASERVLKDFYMDDLMTGCMTVDEGVQVYKEMNELLGKAGFELQKWTSNSNQLIKAMKLENNGKEIEDELKIKHDEIIKILGLTWNRNSDDFQYSVKLPPMKKLATKRTIISDISRLYDPLGWVAPSIILAKVMIQKLWLTGLGWDEDVPCKLLQEWSTYREELNELTKVHIPRWRLKEWLHGEVIVKKYGLTTELTLWARQEN
ncbi:uncharacterized protein [Choristoneura fumiferana]|uniref:uncharacterized protein n=1 Tax=Choristoneura fumiferana TaxID=7141 RepID=UPI003D1549D5